MRLLPRPLTATALVVLGTGVAACGSDGTAATDHQAGVLAQAIAYPRQHDASGFARAALATTLGRSGTFAVLEASDLDPSSSDDPAARLVIRIHVPAHATDGFGDTSTSAVDACYRIEYALPSSELLGAPGRVDCPDGAVPVTPPPLPPAPRLPGNTSAVVARVLRSLPPSPTQADASAAFRSALPPQVRLDVLVRPDEVAVAAAVGSAEQIDCRVAVRTGKRVHAVAPAPESLQPGEVGCRAGLAFLD